MSKINLENLKFINPKFEEKINNNVDTLINEIKKKLYADYTNLSPDKAESPEFVKLVCCALECCNVIQPENPMYKINKKDLVIRILKEMFPSKNNVPEYVERMEAFIQFIHNNGLIKGVSEIKKVKKGLKDYLSKPFC